MSYKAEFSDDRGRSFASNALRFATEEEAKSYGTDLFWRWLGATDWRVIQSDDPVTHIWENGRLREYCECSPEYGPCEQHCDVLVVREGASLHTGDELVLLQVQDLVDCGVKLSGYNKAEQVRLDKALEEARNPTSGTAWLEPDDGEAANDLLLRVQSQAEGLWVCEDDGYRIVRPHDDCPLLEN